MTIELRIKEYDRLAKGRSEHSSQRNQHVQRCWGGNLLRQRVPPAEQSPEWLRRVEEEGEAWVIGREDRGGPEPLSPPLASLPVSWELLVSSEPGFIV